MQKYPKGTRVKIADDLSPYMSNFPSGMSATVINTYAEEFGGSNYKQYYLDVDGHGPTAWYYEHQLTPEHKYLNFKTIKEYLGVK